MKMMYEIDEKLKPYYDETDPEKRKVILEELKAASGDDSYRTEEELFGKRYLKNGADILLRVLIDLMGISKVSVFAIGWNVKNIKKTMDKAGFDAALEDGDTGRRALYNEIRNAVKRYMETCESESYGAAYSGLIKISKEEQKAKMAEQLYEMSYGARAHMSGVKQERLEEYMDILCEAADDEYNLRSGMRLERGEM
ncbi:MAG: hypothetical protein II732_02520 [Lachnospiraceae bacterium]|nr:hypothetical protein [Lachnospiraceae bacterium]